MKINILLASFAACAPLVAGQFSCQCQAIPRPGTNGRPAFYAGVGCTEVRGVLCFDSNANTNSCITSTRWTPEQCRRWNGNSDDATYEAICVGSGSSCSS